MLQTIAGLDMEEQDEAGSSNEIGFEGACGRGMGSSGRDNTMGMGTQDDCGDDIDGSIGDDLPMSGVE